MNKPWYAATVILCLTLTACGHMTPTPVVTPAQPSKPPVAVAHPPTFSGKSPTTGLPEKHETGRFFAATVENYPDARPQTGLTDADIIYEMEAEGTITRYLAIFHDHFPNEVGPSRSARPYFVQTAEDWGAPFVHFGGSPDAYQMLTHYPYHQIDGIYQDSYFSRDPSRLIPHNAYLHPSRLPNYHDSVHGGHFAFGSPSVWHGKPATTLELEFNTFTNVKYVYEPTAKHYVRDQQGTPDDDRATGQQMYADNVILQYTVMSAIRNDPKERITIDLSGPNKAIYFINGQAVSGTWKRTASGTVKYFDGQGKLMILKPGKTWIEVVDHTVAVNWQ